MNDTTTHMKRFDVIGSEAILIIQDHLSAILLTMTHDYCRAVHSKDVNHILVNWYLIWSFNLYQLICIVGW